MNVGDKVKYTNPETGRKKTGIIHGIRKAEAETGEFILSYLIDTGEDNHVDTIIRDPRGEEIGHRLRKAIGKNPKIGRSQDLLIKEVGKIEQHTDLPEGKTFEETIRQPKFVDVLPADVEPV